jgi:hypothetical protein
MWEFVDAAQISRIRQFNASLLNHFHAFADQLRFLVNTLNEADDDKSELAQKGQQLKALEVALFEEIPLIATAQRGPALDDWSSLHRMLQKRLNQVGDIWDKNTFDNSLSLLLAEAIGTIFPQRANQLIAAYQNALQVPVIASAGELNVTLDNSITFPNFNHKKFDKKLERAFDNSRKRKKFLWWSRDVGLDLGRYHDLALDYAKEELATAYTAGKHSIEDNLNSSLKRIKIQLRARIKADRTALQQLELQTNTQRQATLAVLKGLAAQADKLGSEFATSSEAGQ